jgi:hypothetical protein
MLPSYAGSYSFYGCIQLTNRKTGDIRLIELSDSSYAIAHPENAKLSSGKWYGALYYRILMNKKDGKKYYTLLGWKGKDVMHTQKVIDVLHFSGDQILFGFPFFKTGNSYSNRLIFEFPAQAVMSLHYEENKKMIVYDHLGTTGAAGSQAVIPGPTGSYDALKFKGGKWMLLKDIDMRTDWKPKKQPKEQQVHEAPVEMVK